MQADSCGSMVVIESKIMFVKLQYSCLLVVMALSCLTVHGLRDDNIVFDLKSEVNKQQ